MRSTGRHCSSNSASERSDLRGVRRPDDQPVAARTPPSGADGAAAVRDPRSGSVG
jgi:hypothetical protein